MRGDPSCYSRRPCNREGLTILLMHSSVRINNSCEVWTRRRIKAATHSYSMIFLIIRSLSWTASNFQKAQQGTQVSEMRAVRSEHREVLNVNVNYGEVFQYLKSLEVSGDLAFKSQQFCKFSIRRCWPIKDSDGLWFSLLLTWLFLRHPFICKDISRVPKDLKEHLLCVIPIVKGNIDHYTCLWLWFHLYWDAFVIHLDSKVRVYNIKSIKQPKQVFHCVASYRKKHFTL